jgi:hypothetical protein
MAPHVRPDRKVCAQELKALHAGPLRREGACDAAVVAERPAYTAEGGIS